ncbi:hypothetical protein G5714_019111 [Onychostoma macrolepis]|uniref:Ig-like domain-containing protein n=2 Tax=Onychostoma macrolepis TaxID=369639 RepID=A0A7J6C2Q9_9TELE|nr:hypothetical protein G5714_019111 [Onychostoma macrolepis]
MGANISLNCSMTNRYVIAWYHLRAKRFNLLISAETGITGRTFLTTYNQNSSHLKMTADTWITRATLVISGVTESDVGLYFCGTKSDTTEMHFDKPISLAIEGRHAEDPCTVTDFSLTSSYTFIKLSVKGGMELQKEDADNTDGVTTTERALMFGGVGLAVFVFFLATVIAGGIIHYHGWQKGWAAAKNAHL